MKNKSIPIGAEHAGDIKHLRISQALLHASADCMMIVFRLDDCYWNSRFVEEDIVGSFSVRREP